MPTFALITEGETDQHVLKNITINALECWLLPLYYADNTKAATTNCLFKLIQQLADRPGSYVDL